MGKWWWPWHIVMLCWCHYDFQGISPPYMHASTAFILILLMSTPLLVRHNDSAPLHVASWIKLSVASTILFEFSVFKCVFNILDIKQINWALRQLRTRKIYFLNLKQLYGAGRYPDVQLSQNSAASRYAQYSILDIPRCVNQGHICLTVL